MEENNFENEEQIQQEEKKEGVEFVDNKKEGKVKRTIFTIILIIIFLLVCLGASFSYYVYTENNGSSLNKDTNGDGWPDLNVSVDGDKVCDDNCDTNKDKKPDYNIGYGYISNGYFSMDTNGDKVADFNLINQDTNKDGVCDINCDIDGDNRPDMNLDFDGDGILDLNIDKNNDKKCDLNCDNNYDRKLDYNIDYNEDGVADFAIDTNGDGKPDKNLINIDKNKDGVCDINCDTTGNGIPDTNIDLNSDNLIDNIEVTQTGTNINLVSGTTYALNVMGETINAQIAPGWSKQSTFTIYNSTENVISYRLQWNNITNTFTEENNLYYGLTRNGITIVNLDFGRVPYSQSQIAKNVNIAPGETHTYVLDLLFKETGINQNVDQGKVFKGLIKIISNN